MSRDNWTTIALFRYKNVVSWPNVSRRSVHGLSTTSADLRTRCSPPHDLTHLYEVCCAILYDIVAALNQLFGWLFVFPFLTSTNHVLSNCMITIRTMDNRSFV